ncbi:MAG: hypothetical protein ACT6QS_14235, partial [Flavobacteriales bacterium]
KRGKSGADFSYLQGIKLIVVCKHTIKIFSSYPATVQTAMPQVCKRNKTGITLAQHCLSGSETVVKRYSGKKFCVLL